MTEPAFDGPRLIQENELRASRRLAKICFNDLSEIDEEEPLPWPHIGKDDGEIHVIACEGKPVSQISTFITPLRVYDSLLKIGSIGGVCTHPDYRGYGLATKLMEHCTRHLADGGAQLMVISGGRGLYRRTGNVPMGRFADFVLRPGEISPAPANIRLREATPADAAFCSSIYQAEPVHFRRTPRAYAARFQPHEIDFHAEEWVVDLDGQPAAYICLNTPWDSMDKPGVRCVFEYAGSRVALVGGLAAALYHHHFSELQVPVPWQDMDLIQLLCAQELSHGWTTLPDHTILVIDFPGLMSALSAYVRSRLDPTLRLGLRFEQSGPLLGHNGGDRYAIVRGKERLELDGAAMTQLVTGSAQYKPVKAPGALADILPALFPLPAFNVGLDYH